MSESIDVSAPVDLGGPPMDYYLRDEPLAGVVVHPDYAHHRNGEHPDNRFKIDRIADTLFAMPWADQLMRFYPRYARPDEIALAHDATVCGARRIVLEGRSWLVRY